MAAINRPGVFIVEDEIVTVRGLEQNLNDLGYRASGFAFSGEEAIALMERQRPEVVLVDIHLKGDMDGIELARKITSDYEIPVIYVTAYSDREILERARITDPSGYIVKPVRLSQLKVTLELALQRHEKGLGTKAALDACQRTIDELRHRLNDGNKRLDEALSALGSVAGEHERSLAKVNELRQELQEVNKSLVNMAAHTVRMRDELEMEVAVAVQARITPILKQLKHDPAFQHYGTEFEMLEIHMDHLSSSLNRGINGASTLSTMELRVAALIKNGLTSEQIATRLFISPETVKTHRRNIRKKLDLRNTSKSLSTYLNIHRA
ncbi:MAG: response regulator [Syntrophobacteraceae bacterium]